MTWAAASEKASSNPFGRRALLVFRANRRAPSGALGEIRIDFTAMLKDPADGGVCSLEAQRRVLMNDLLRGLAAIEGRDDGVERDPGSGDADDPVASRDERHGARLERVHRAQNICRLSDRPGLTRRPRRPAATPRADFGNRPPGSAASSDGWWAEPVQATPTNVIPLAPRRTIPAYVDLRAAAGHATGARLDP